MVISFHLILISMLAIYLNRMTQISQYLIKFIYTEEIFVEIIWMVDKTACYIFALDQAGVKLIFMLTVKPKH